MLRLAAVASLTAAILLYVHRRRRRRQKHAPQLHTAPSLPVQATVVAADKEWFAGPTIQSAIPIACECHCGLSVSFTQTCPRRRLFPIESAIQHYGWGKLGSASLVARLAAVDQRVRVDETLPYSEMWIGAHPSGPAKVTMENLRKIELSAWMERRYWTSTTLYRKHALPYLFKVLSVRTALSIQSHPDKALARKLHARDPAHYKDDNHKPELTCAISEFEVLCSFRAARELVDVLRSCPELSGLVGADTVARFTAAAAADPQGSGTARQALCELYSRLMRADEERVRASLKKLVGRLEMGVGSDAEALALRLHQQYPGDVGVFCAFLLNHRILAPGECLFLPANEPHAYIAGDCVECMACSYNVVRAGLTPKFKDVDVLCDSLTYTMGPPHVLPPEGDKADIATGEGVLTFRPPVPEFQLRRVLVPRGEVCTLPASASVGSVVVCRGHGTARDSADHKYVMRPGFTMLVLPNTTVAFEAQEGELLVFACSEQAGADRKTWA